MAVIQSVYEKFLVDTVSLFLLAVREFRILGSCQNFHGQALEYPLKLALKICWIKKFDVTVLPQLNCRSQIHRYY